MKYKNIKTVVFAIICNLMIMPNLIAVSGPGFPPPPPPVPSAAVPELLSIAHVLGISILGLFLLRWRIGKK